MRSRKVSMKDRLKAAELQGKTQGDFIKRISSKRAAVSAGARMTAGRHDAPPTAIIEPVRLKLHAGQSIVRRSPAQFRVCVTGRRWGKTTLDKAEAMVEFGTPGLVWFLAPTYDMARDLMWEPIRALTPRSWLSREPNETRMELDTLWGCRFACKSVEHPDRLRGRGPRKIIGDEFQDWKDGQRTWEEVLLPSLLTTNGRALLTGTPKSFNHLHAPTTRGSGACRAGPRGSSARSTRRISKRRRCRRSSRRCGPRWTSGPTGRSSRRASKRSPAAPTTRFSARRTRRRRCSSSGALPVACPFDFNINPATAVIGQGRGLDAWVWREVYLSHAGGEATRAAAMRVKQLLAEVGWDGPMRIYGDPAGTSAKTTGPSDHAVLREVFPTATWCIPRSHPHVKDRVAAVNAAAKRWTARGI
jgi:hypothetical protein